jgi:hypothetical protein
LPWPPRADPPTSTLRVGGIIGVNNHAPREELSITDLEVHTAYEKEAPMSWGGELPVESLHPCIMELSNSLTLTSLEIQDSANNSGSFRGLARPKTYNPH